MSHLLIGMAKAAGRFCNADLAQDFARSQSSRKQIYEEVVRRDRSLAANTENNHLSVQRKDRGGPIAGWVGMRNATANRAFVPDLHVANVRGTLRQERTNLL